MAPTFVDSILSATVAYSNAALFSLTTTTTIQPLSSSSSIEQHDHNFNSNNDLENPQPHHPLDPFHIPRYLFISIYHLYIKFHFIHLSNFFYSFYFFILVGSKQLPDFVHFLQYSFQPLAFFNI